MLFPLVNSHPMHILHHNTTQLPFTGSLISNLHQLLIFLFPKLTLCLFTFKG